MQSVLVWTLLGALSVQCSLTQTTPANALFVKRAEPTSTASVVATPSNPNKPTGLNTTATQPIPDGQDNKSPTDQQDSAKAAQLASSDLDNAITDANGSDSPDTDTDTDTAGDDSVGALTRRWNRHPLPQPVDRRDSSQQRRSLFRRSEQGLTGPSGAFQMSRLRARGLKVRPPRPVPEATVQLTRREVEILRRAYARRNAKVYARGLARRSAGLSRRAALAMAMAKAKGKGKAGGQSASTQSSSNAQSLQSMQSMQQQQMSMSQQMQQQQAAMTHAQSQSNARQRLQRRQAAYL